MVVAIAAYALFGDVQTLGNRLDNFGWMPAFVAALGLSLANYAIRFLRWQMYLRRQQVSVPVGTMFQPCAFSTLSAVDTLNGYGFVFAFEG